MDLEADLAASNADFFLREFTYSGCRFRDANRQERQLCDCAIWIDDLLVLLEVKERNPDEDSDDPETESKWFEHKISKKSVGQLSASIRHLETESTLPLMNRRSQAIDLSGIRPSVVHKVVVYRSSEALPLHDLYKKGRRSERIGFVHFIHVDDYVGVCLTLYTPREISDYLTYRAEAATQNQRANELPEKALLGKYLTDTGFDGLEHADELYVDRLVDDRAGFSIGNLLHAFPDRIVSGNDGTQYHAILVELARLPRSGLKLFRERLLWAMDKCLLDKPPIPSRFSFPSTDCSFIFIPLAASEREKSHDAALSYTILSKYDFRTTRAIGVAVSPHTDEGASQAQWCLLNSQWESNHKLDAYLASGSIFRTITPTWLGKYSFDVI